MSIKMVLTFQKSRCDGPTHFDSPRCIVHIDARFLNPLNETRECKQLHVSFDGVNRVSIQIVSMEKIQSQSMLLEILLRTDKLVIRLLAYKFIYRAVHGQ